MKTLLIISHPEISESASQQFFLNAITPTDDITIHHLDACYATSPIDVERELDLLNTHDRIIFQFPLYWYSAPALLKEWQDLVFSAKGIWTPGGTLLAGKEFGIVLAVGVNATAYQAGGREGVTIDELMRPYQAVARHMGMTYLPTFATHQFSYLSEKAKLTLLVAYRYYLLGASSTSIVERSTWLLNQLGEMDMTNYDEVTKNKIQQVGNYLYEKKEQLVELNETLENF